MAQVNQDSFLFVVEWFDPMPQLKRKYLLKYFIEQHMVEMIDLKSKKMFLKKSVCPPELTKDDFVLGAKVLLYSRMLEIVDYGDLKTRDRLQHQVQKIVAILPANTYSSWGIIIDALNSNLNIADMKTVIIPASLADSICDALEINMRASSTFSQGVCLSASFYGEDAFNIAKKLLREFASSDSTEFYCSTNGTETQRLGECLLDNRSLTNTATFDSCTCGIVKPHAVKSKHVGKVLDVIISQGYEISAVSYIYFEMLQAEEFYEVYKDVIPEYGDHVTQLCSGPSIALEIRAEDAVNVFRQTAGPWDCDMAKELRPESVRGKLGEDNIRNALHCTDLPTDGVLECEYCFRILQ